MLRKGLTFAGVALVLLATAQAKLYPLKEAEVVKYLNILTNSKEDRERAMAALRLGVAEVDHQKKDLEKSASSDPDRQVRLTCRLSLYVLGARQDLEPIIEALERTRLTHYPANHVLMALRFRHSFGLTAKATPIGAKRINWYVKLLETAQLGVNHDTGLRDMAGLILGELNAPEAVRALERHFELDQPVSVRKAAFSGLTAKQGEEVRNFQARVLRSDPQLEVRVLAAYHLQDNEFSRRFQSTGTLFTPALELWRVFTEHEDPMLREAILRSLLGNGFRRDQLEPLVSYLNDETPPGVRDAIEKLLERAEESE